jgi:hypothetical protein
MVLGISGSNISHAPSGISSAFAIPSALIPSPILYSPIYEITSNKLDIEHDKKCAVHFREIPTFC